MSIQDKDLIGRRNAIKMGVASLSSVGLISGVEAHTAEAVKTPFVVAQTLIPIAGLSLIHI